MTIEKVPLIAPNGLEVGGTEGMVLPVGTTAQRGSTPKQGTTRGNVTDGTIEVFMEGKWTTVGGALAQSPTITSGMLAVKNTYYPVDTSGGGMTIQLPASPSIGDRVAFFDIANSWQTKMLTVNGNGQKIDKDTTILRLRAYSGFAMLTYISADYGWRTATQGQTMPMTIDTSSYNGIDIDDVRSNQRTTVRAPVSTLGLPEGVTNSSTLFIDCMSLDNWTFVYQSVVDVWRGTKFSRSMINGVWGEWKKDHNSTDTPLKMIKTVGPGSFLKNRHYLCIATQGWVLPEVSGLVWGDIVRVSKLGGVTPNIRVHGGAGELIRLYDKGTSTLKKKDTSVTFNIHAELVFIWNGVNWEL